MRTKFKSSTEFVQTTIATKAYRLEPRILFDAAAPAVIADALHAVEGGSLATHDIHDGADAPHDAPSAPGVDAAHASDGEQVARILCSSDADYTDPLIRALVDKSATGARASENISDEEGDTAVLLSGQMDTSFSRGLAQADEHTVIVIDASVDGSDTMVDNAGDATVIVVQPGQDAFALVADRLEGRTDVTAIHIISHGSEGKLSLAARPWMCRG